MSRLHLHRMLAIVACVAAGGCAPDETRSAAQQPAATAPDTAPGKVQAATVDSALPRDEELARFRRPLGAAPAKLNGGFPTRNALVKAYLARLAARDTAGLVALALTKAEFAWFYYPTNPLAAPPYDLSPGLMWFQFEGNSRKGLLHALAERGGTDLKVTGYDCADRQQQGANVVFLQCALRRLQAPGDTVSEVLFGGIMERDGIFKLIGFANKL